MKILLTTDPEIPVPPKYYGGAERLASDLIDEYIKLGHQVVLVANRESKKTNVDHFYAWPSDSSVGLKNILRNSLFLLKVYRNTCPDIIHSFSRICYLYSLLFTKAKAVKRYGRFISPRSTSLANMILGKRIQFVAAAKHMTSHLKDRDSWRIIYNFVDTDFYKYNFDKPKRGFVFIGRIEDIKGVNEAIRVANQLGEQLVIAGNIEPEHQTYFDEYVGPLLTDKIRYVGMVDNYKKLKLLQQAKAILFPIKWEEPFGIVMAESLACGTPVLAFKRGSVPEIVLDGVNGFVSASVEEMAQSARNLSNIDPLKVRNTALANYSRKGAARAYLTLFDEVLHRS